MSKTSLAGGDPLENDASWLSLVLRSLNDADSEVRDHGRRLLNEYGTIWRRFILESLASPDVELRRGAASAVAQLHEGSSEVVSALLSALGDSDEWVRSECCWACESLGEHAKRAAPQLLSLLRDPCWSVRQAAISALVAVSGFAQSVVRDIADGLHDKQWNVRSSAAKALGKFAIRPQEVQKELVRCFADPEPSVRIAAASAFSRLDQNDDILRALCELLEDADFGVRAAVANTIAAFGPRGCAGLRQLTRNFAVSDDSVRHAARKAVVAIGPPAIPALQLALDSSDGFVAAESAKALGDIRHSTPAVLDGLRKHLNDRDETVRVCASEALWQLTGAADIESVVSVLGSANEEAAYTAAVFISRLGRRAINAEVGLVASLMYGSRRIQHAAITAIARVGARGEVTIQSLASKLEQRDKDIATAAARALGTMGPAARKSIPSLLRHVGDEDEDMQIACIRATGRLALTGDHAMEVLQRVSDEFAGDIRGAAERAIKKINKRSIHH